MTFKKAVLSILVLILCCTAAYAQELEMAIEVTDSRVSDFDPLPITIRLRNSGSSPLALPDIDSSSFGRYITVFAEDVESGRQLQSFEFFAEAPRLRASNTRTLEPGEEMTLGHTLNRAASGYHAFDESGELIMFEGGEVSLTARYHVGPDNLPLAGDAALLRGDFTTAVPATIEITSSWSQFQANEVIGGTQVGSSAAISSSGDIFLVWESGTSSEDDISGTSVQGRIYQKDGTVVTPQFQINNITTGSQEHPAVAFDDQGRAFAVWVDSVGIWGRMFSSTGEALGEQVRLDTDGSYGAPKVGWYEKGFVLAWQSSATDMVYARLLSLEGEPSSDQFTVNQSPASEYDAKLAVSRDGDFAVAWGDQGTGMIFARTFTKTTPITSQFELGSGHDPSVYTTPSGEFIAAWSHFGISMQRFSQDGILLGELITLGSGIFPEVAIDDAGKIFVVWQDNLKIMGQLMADDLSLIGSPFLINTHPLGAGQRNPLPKASSGPSGLFLATWRSVGSPGNDPDDSIQVRVFCYTCANSLLDNPPIFEDGFESGNTTHWSKTVP